MIWLSFLLLVVAGLAPAQSLDYGNCLEDHNTEVLMAKVITKGIHWKLQQEVSRHSHKTPIISPIKDDPLVIPELIDTPVNINIPDIFAIVGNLFIGETEISGLSGLVDDFRMSMPIVVIPMSMNWTMGLPNATISGPFEISGTIDSPQEDKVYEMEGTGDFTGSVEDVFFRVNAVGRAPAFGNMELQFLDVDLGFKNLAFSFDGLNVGGNPFDLSNIAPLIQLVFDTLWTDTTRPVVNEMIRCSLNHTVARCNIQQLIQGYWECLELSLNPKCFGEEVEEPTTVEPSTVTEDDGSDTTVTATVTDDGSNATVTATVTDDGSDATVTATVTDDGSDSTTTSSREETTTPDHKGGAVSMLSFHNNLYIMIGFFVWSMLNFLY